MVVGRSTNSNEDSSHAQEDKDASNKCNGTTDESGYSQEISQATYQFLLEQMENLRQENCSLKAGLKSNTSHITKLESEASRMKDMVLMLGSPALSNTSVESEYTPSTQPFLSVKFQSDHTGGFMPEESSSYNLLNQNFLHAYNGAVSFPTNFDKPTERKRRSDIAMGAGSSSHHILRQDNLMSSQAMHSHEYFTPSPSNNFSDVIRNLLASMKEERVSTMKSLILEEQKKEFYMRKLQELTSRLDSDKFSKPSDEITLQLEHEIAKLKRTMEISLGSSDAMQERLDARLKHIQFLDFEISNLEQLSGKSDFSLSSTDNDSLRNTNTQACLSDTGALCIRHGSFHQNGVNVTEISTQTSKWNITPQELRKFDESQSLCEATVRDASSPLSPGRVTRSIQTILSVKIGYGWIKSRHRNLDGFETPPNRSTPPSWIEIKQRDSFDSLQSDFDDTASMHSFTTSLPRSTKSPRGSKKDDMFVSLLAQSDREEMTRRIMRMGETIDGCRTLKQLGYMRLIIQVMHDGSLLAPTTGAVSLSSPNQANPVPQGFLESVKSIRMRLSKVLGNIVNVTSETKSNRDVQIFHTLEFLRRYCELLFEFLTDGSNSTDPNPNAMRDNTKNFRNEYDGNPTDLSHSSETHRSYDMRNGLSIVFGPPINKVTFIMKLAYDENIKRVINEYGGLYAIAELFILHYRCVTASEVARSKLGNDAPKSDERTLQLLRRFVGFALINLTYGDIHNKTALIQMPGLIDTIVLQMTLDSEEMQQVMALFVRNLCWQADEKCREILKKKDITCVFTKCALKAKREDTLKSLLSALWNLSGHCSENRHSICTVKGALAFLVSTLISRVPDIVESGGGILRNVSSVVATNNDYRAILREQNCLQILLKHLKSGSLTIVSNACGTLWNLSARNAQDQKLLRDLGAIPMLKNLTHSKHSVIAQGSNAALRNLLARRPGSVNQDRDEHVKIKGKRPAAIEMKEDGKSSIDRDFSPQQPATKSNVSQRIISPQVAMNPQRHSLQEKSTFTPPSELEARLFSNRNYPGSLGSLPYSEFGDNVQQQNSQAVKYISRRNGSSFHDQYSTNLPGSQRRNGSFSPAGNGVSNDVKISNDKMRTNSRSRQNNGNANRLPGSLSLRDYFIMIAETKSLHSATGPSPNNNSSGAPVVPVVQSQMVVRTTDPKSLFRLDMKDLGESSGKSLFQDGSPIRVPDVQKLLGQTGNPNVSKISNAIGAKCPKDLVMSLCNVEDDYGNDDGPVNYSLQFCDEHMTPGIRSPRTEEIYELDAGPDQPESHSENYIQNRPGSIPPSAAATGPRAKSEGGLSALSSCVESTGSSIAVRQDILKNYEKNVKTDMKLHANLPALSSFNFHGEHKIDPSSILDGDDDKPTDFSALYSEEQLFEPIEHESLGMEPYDPSKEQNFSLKESSGTARHSEESREKKSEENAKIIESKEEDDKFDTGAITPGRAYLYRSGRTSGIMTPRTPLEYETPMMFSRSSSLDSVSTIGSIHSSITSGPTSRMMSGAVSPSHLPDSPSQSMPISPRRSPPPQIVASHPADVDQQKQDQMGLHNKKLLKNTKMSTPMKESELAYASSVERHRNKTVKFISPGYVTSLPHSDELNVYKSEGAMSVMTKFSALTIDSSIKVQPMCENDDVVLSQSNDSTSNQDSSKKEKSNNGLDTDSPHKDDGLPKEQVPVIGYVTSLPTSDEIMTFMHEGTLSPMTAFSEITCLQDDNDGFQKTTGSVFSIPHSSVSARAERAHSVTSKVSIASRSSATGESAPQDYPTNQNVSSEKSEKLEKESVERVHSSLDNSENSKSTDVRKTPKGCSDAKESDSDDSLSSCSDDDDDLLQQCINQAIPKKVSRSSSKSSKHSSKSSKSSRSKEKSNTKQSTSSGNESPSRKNEERAKNNPSPDIPDMEKPKLVNIKQRIESANMKLQGISIVQYMDNLINPEDGAKQQNPPKSNATKSKQVASNDENLSQSYSVKKKLKEDKKKEAQENAKPKPRVEDVPRVSAKVLPIEPSRAAQSKLRVHSYLKEGVTSYATEGTPIEMSRSTSLSNITIESDSADADNMMSQLKASNSVPDIPSVSTINTTDVLPGVVDYTDDADAAKEANLPSRHTPESHDILENLEKQIENMRIATVASMVNSKGPGYTTSIPEVDEIKKYRAEGSICGATEFSALTVDSDTKIAPLLSNKGKILPSSAPAKSEICANNALPKVSTTERKPAGCDEMETSLRLPVPVPKQVPVWENEGYIHPSGHYNDENDNLGMKEERHNYMNEDTPLYLSGGSLSSLEFGSDDDNDLLKECISSALPPEKAPGGQSYMGAAAMTTPNTHTSESLRLYSHGAPDGKVDDSLLTNSNYGNMQFAVTSQAGQFQSYNQGFLSSTREQFPMLNRKADASNLMQENQMSLGITPSQISPSGFPATASFHSLSQPSHPFQHISRQPAVPDNDFLISSSSLGKRQDVVVGQSEPPAKSSASISNQRHATVRTKTHNDRVARPVKNHSSNKHDVGSTRRSRMQAPRAVDSSSGSSASYRQQQRHHHLSSNSRSTEMCGCQASYSGPSSQSRRYNRGSVSTSTSQLADDMRQSSRSRRKSNNSTSKNSMRACDHNVHHHHHHPPKPTRPRNSAKNVYRPGIVQLYPPLKDMVGVLEGVASVAARGDKVVADRTQQYSMGEMSVKSSNSSLVRSATFINDNPSEILLENMSQEEREQYAARSSVSSRSQTQADVSTGNRGRIPSASPHGSIHSLKQSSHASTVGGSNPGLKAQVAYSTKPKSIAKQKAGKKKGSGASKSKPKKVWSGIKKLLSPSDENSWKVKEEKNDIPDRAVKTPLLRRIQSGHTKPPKDASSVAPDRKGSFPPHLTALSKKKSSSSLSLTSSSDSNMSSSADSPAKNDQDRVTPFGHLPKSPSVNALMRRQIITVPQYRSTGEIKDHPANMESSVWRRTNPSESGIHVANSISSQQSSVRKPESLENYDPWLEQDTSPEDAQKCEQLNNTTQLSPKSPYDSIQPLDQQKVGQSASSFNSPSRTLSPRVVQEVAPFNYRPTRRRTVGEERDAQSKGAPDDGAISHGCKQTPL